MRMFAGPVSKDKMPDRFDFCFEILEHVLRFDLIHANVYEHDLSDDRQNLMKPL